VQEAVKNLFRENSFTECVISVSISEMTGISYFAFNERFCVAARIVYLLLYEFEPFDLSCQWSQKKKRQNRIRIFVCTQTRNALFCDYGRKQMHNCIRVQ